MFPETFFFRLRALSIASAAVAALSLLSGCGIGTADTSVSSAANDGIANHEMGGILHGGPNAIVGATITLYVTNTTGISNPATASSYGSAATAVTSTTTRGDGSFNLPTVTNSSCPAGEYAYIGAYGGDTGAYAVSGNTNTTTFLMAPVGPCSTNYNSTGYIGGNIFINELTTAVSAYALGNFMSLVPNATTGVVDVNIGAPKNNSFTASASVPSAAGLAHAFANSLAIVNIATGVPRTTKTGGGTVPTQLLYLVGNLLQACVNSNGLITGAGAVTPTATANDGSGCGILFSVTTPPNGATPTNTLQAMIDLAHYAVPYVTTWNSGCTSAGSGTTTGIACLFNLATPQSAYAANSLTAAPPDFTLSIGFATGYGVQTTGCTGTCSGLATPHDLALDYQDNVYVMNWSNSTPSAINFLSFGYDGTPIFASPQQSSYLNINNIATDTAGHSFGVNSSSTTGASTVVVYGNTNSAAVTTVTGSSFNINEAIALADPLNNILVFSTTDGISIRKLTYTAGTPPTYTVSSISNSATAAVTSNGVLEVNYGNNLDLFIVTGPTTSPLVNSISNSSTYTKTTPAAATYGNINAGISIGGNTTNAFGIVGLGTGNAVAISSVGATPITKSSGNTLSAGTAVALPIINTTTNLNYFRRTAVDGAGTVYALDGTAGNYGSGAAVFIPATGSSFSTGGIVLGTYKGCYIKSGATTCGTYTAGVGNGTTAIIGPRGIAIDSAGDIWIASGVSQNVTEMIGAAAPTWPGKSMGLQGMPQ